MNLKTIKKLFTKRKKEKNIENLVPNKTDTDEIIPNLTLVKDFLKQIDPSILQIHLAKAGIYNLSGSFVPVKKLDAVTKSILAQNYAYSEWARIALDVASQYGGGDYFEFGSEGLNTLCNFLTTFHFNGHDKNFPNTRFFAFDVFGDPKKNEDLNPVEKDYFKVHTRTSSFPSYFEEMQAKLKEYGIMENRVELIKGYFKESLNEKLKERLRNEKRYIGFAFLDCNIAPSYETALNFLEEFMHPAHSFIYLDEYFQNFEVTELYKKFCERLYKRFGLRSFYVRTSGSFGALFRLLK